MGFNDLFPVNDNISKVPTKRYIFQKIIKLSPRWFDDTNFDTGLFVKTLHNLNNNYEQIIAHPGERDLTNILYYILYIYIANPIAY